MLSTSREMSTFNGIGCMSGSSLDGLDICHVEFTGDLDADIWGYRILQGETIPYAKDWEERLQNSNILCGRELIQLHVQYGHFIGKTVSDFMERNKIRVVDFVASHGHTVFHQPGDGYTFQLGEGETTAIYLSCPFVCNFRCRDVALGGQGAPLVPVGEKFLFSYYEICINIGGIANIGLRGEMGYDICASNSVLNHLASITDSQLKFDNEGRLAESGTVVEELLEKLEGLGFYKEPPPKSLDRSWTDANVLPLLDCNKYKTTDLLRTYTEHVATRISAECIRHKSRISDVSSKSKTLPKILLTGGGAFNKFLVRLIRDKLKVHDLEIDEVDEGTINFKEALVFAFLGLRCLLGEENVHSDVTGAKTNSVSGSIHRPLKVGLKNEIGSSNSRFTVKLHRQTSMSP
ncbi:hypothetical protein CHS0354_028037 [Potamilus streckersoni]|uniref:Anhydro-N-acetylmuramic acid kinase n=1 Tax=Potamilus streckersoni TaxID=2493646 RepID=A0AAE0THR3_9BIVA|nr:hypothetical protein CHS0354_028037 [Potamilus streckersoni]